MDSSNQWPIYAHVCLVAGSLWVVARSIWDVSMGAGGASQEMLGQAQQLVEISTLRLHGVSEAEIDEVEEVLGVKFPVPTRILYRICDGQDMRGQLRPTAPHGSPLGLIGRYRFSGHLVNVYLLPLHEAAMKTRSLRRNVKEFAKQWGTNNKKLVLVAASSTFTRKYIFLDCTDGQLYAATGRFSPVVEGEELRMIPCVPQCENQRQEAMVAWLEEHGRRLDEGVIGLGEDILFDGRRCISLYPSEGDPALCTTIVTTNGVKVCASVVFAPELADFRGGDEFRFGYSIRMWFLPEGKLLKGVKNLRGNCELHWRRSITRADDGALVSDVNNRPGMLELPVRSGPGETKQFFFESNTTLQTTSGTLEGYFTLRLDEANGGGPFDVVVPRFSLKVADYVF